MNSIMTSDEASEKSEFLSALDVSLESFVHKALKDIQIECIHRECYISINSKSVISYGPYSQCRTDLKPPLNSLFFAALQSETVPSLSDMLVAQR